MKTKQLTNNYTQYRINFTSSIAVSDLDDNLVILQFTAQSSNDSYNNNSVDGSINVKTDKNSSLPYTDFEQTGNSWGQQNRPVSLSQTYFVKKEAILKTGATTITATFTCYTYPDTGKENYAGILNIKEYYIG